jgi:hypothetical protein
MIATCPVMTSPCAAGLPLYGMWFNWIPAVDLNISIVRWLVEPLPSEAKAIAPGFALAAATRSLTDLCGEEEPVTSVCGVSARFVIGAKSRSASYGSFEYSVGLMPNALETPIVSV